MISGYHRRETVSGGGKESRTPDLWNANPTLYQLSYTPIAWGICLNLRIKARQLCFSALIFRRLYFTPGEEDYMPASVLHVYRAARRWEKYLALAGACSLGLLLNSCNGSKKKTASAEDAAKVSTLETEFALSGETHNVPMRFLLAVAYLESHIAETPTSVDYGGKHIIPPNGESAFGIPRAQLELPAEIAIDLQSQADAYAHWLAQNVQLLLVKDPQTVDEKMQWIFEIALLHRKTADTQALFARELLTILNLGFNWYDTRRHEFVNLSPESPTIDIVNLSKSNQSRLTLDLRSAQTMRARTLILAKNIPAHLTAQVPTGVELVHCPFSLSACLDLQIVAANSSTFSLGAHYIIPQDPTLVDFPLQVALHEIRVSYLGTDGGITATRDKIRLMLVGYSGRFLAGSRLVANPDWLSKWQLQSMGQLVSELCGQFDKKTTLRPSPQGALASDSSEDTACTTIGKGLTVTAPLPGASSYKWGEILDFDPLVFSFYLGGGDRQIDESKLILNEQNRVVEAGQEIAMGLEFSDQAMHLELSRLVRCPNGTPIWSPVERGEIQGESSYQFYNKRYWDGGANSSGEQFFRAKVFGKDKNFLGWDVVHLTIRDFIQGYEPSPPDECFE